MGVLCQRAYCGRTPLVPHTPFHLVPGVNSRWLPVHWNLAVMFKGMQIWSRVNSRPLQWSRLLLFSMLLLVASSSPEEGDETTGWFPGSIAVPKPLNTGDSMAYDG